MYRDGQQAHKKITNHQGTANQNHTTSHLSERFLSKWREATCIYEDVEKRESLYTVGSVNWCNPCRKQYEAFSEKLK